VSALAGQGELQTSLAKRLFGSLRSMDWSTAECFSYSIGEQKSGWVVTRDDQGTPGYPEYPLIDFEALTELKKLMADPITGTWFSVSFTVTKQGRFTFSYNYDRRVYGETTTPTPFDDPGYRAMIDDQDWLDEFRLYPRSPEHLPVFVANLKPTEPLVVDQQALRVALGTPIPLAAGDAPLADADGWAEAIAVIADAAKSRLRQGKYPELLQSPYSNDWKRSEEALMEDVYTDAVASILRNGDQHRLRRLYASLRSAGIGAEANGEAKAIRGEVVSVIGRLVENDVLTRLAAIGRK
jgi:hypothetical protein